MAGLSVLRDLRRFRGTVYNQHAETTRPAMEMFFARTIGAGRIARAPPERITWPFVPETVSPLKTIEAESRDGEKAIAFVRKPPGDRNDTDRDGKVTREEFRGPDAIFERLDRNRDGVITRADFGERSQEASGAGGTRRRRRL